MVNVIGTHQQADELLLHVAIFVGGLGRGERSERAAVRGKFLRHQIQRLIPGRLGEHAILADQRRGQAILVLDEGEAKTSLHTQHPLAGLVGGVVEYVDEAVIFVYLHRDATSDATVGTHALDLAGHLGARRLGVECPGRTDRHALTTRRADRVNQLLIHKGGNVGLLGRASDGDGADVLNILAGRGAAPAHDAGFVVELEDGVAVVHFRPWLGG